MSVDYDIVVIGTNVHAYELVSLASQAQARVESNFESNLEMAIAI
jgi:hypothetical protein